MVCSGVMCKASTCTSFDLITVGKLIVDIMVEGVVIQASGSHL